MKTSFTKLISLAEIDAEIDNLNEIIESIPKTIQDLEKSLGAIKAPLNESKANLKSQESERKSKEIDLQQKKDWIAAREVKVKEIKTNKEYHAALREITNAQKEAAKLEEEVLALLEKIETETKKINELESTIDDKTQSFKAAINQKQDELTSQKQKIASIFEARKLIDKEVDKDLLNKYNTINTRIKPAMAIAENGTCLECNTRIPPQLYIEIQRLTKIIICPSCHRILYMKEH